MEAPLPRKAITTTVTRQVSFQIRSTARTLGDLATALSVDWDKMEDAERLALMRKVRQLAVDLGHLAERNGEPGPPTTDPETGLHWVDGLLFLTPREYEVLQALALGIHDEDRRAARYQPIDGTKLREEHPGQARRSLPHRGCFSAPHGDRPPGESGLRFRPCPAAGGWAGVLATLAATATDALARRAK